MTDDEMKDLAVKALRAIETGAPFLGSLLGDVGSRVGPYVGAAVGLAADLLEGGDDPVERIQEIRSSVPDFNRVTDALRRRARGT